MKTPQNPLTGSTTALVKELNDTALRSGHALLNNTRAQEFSGWMDRQSALLEQHFLTFSTPQSVRRSLGR